MENHLYVPNLVSVEIRTSQHAVNNWDDVITPLDSVVALESLDGQQGFDYIVFGGDTDFLVVVHVFGEFGHHPEVADWSDPPQQFLQHFVGGIEVRLVGLFD